MKDATDQSGNGLKLSLEGLSQDKQKTLKVFFFWSSVNDTFNNSASCNLWHQIRRKLFCEQIQSIFKLECMDKSRVQKDHTGRQKLPDAFRGCVESFSTENKF